MMTHSITSEALEALGAPDLVYVRQIKARDVLAGAVGQSAEGLSFDPDQTLYALHRADGVRLAVLADRQAAYAAAIAHELVPVSVH